MLGSGLLVIIFFEELSECLCAPVSATVLGLGQLTKLSVSCTRFP